MITGMEIAACQHMAVPAEVMQHVVNVESGYNPFAIGVVGGKLVRQPQNLDEALATVHMLDEKGYNYSLGVAQVNRANLSKYGLATYEQAFDVCPNLAAGARILSQCYASSGNDWGKSFSCYYSGNFVTGYRDGYVQKIYDSINGIVRIAANNQASAIPLQPASGAAPSSIHGVLNGSTAFVSTDSASYRLAIRSTMLDTVASMATRSATGSMTQPPIVPAANPTAQQEVMPSMPTPNEASNLPPESLGQIEKTSASANVFEPQVRSLGDPQTALPNSPNDQAQIASSPKPSVDKADLSKGGTDDAFVF